MRPFFLWILLTSFVPTHGLEVFSAKGASPAKAWTLVYSEDKQWLVDRIRMDRDGWPQLDSRHRFGTQSDAKEDLQHEQTLESHDALPESRAELRGEANDVLWTVTHQWDWQWEEKYANWVKTNIHADWWREHHLATDCADLAYSARWIFARENGLPMASRLASGHWFTHRSVRPAWRRLPRHRDWDKDQRFLAALNYMLDLVFTHTLWNDSYPIAINPQIFLPGVHHLNLFGGSGHTQFVYRVGTQPDELPVLTLNSTIPREVRTMKEYLFTGQDVREDGEAFLRFRWPRFNHDHVNLVAGAQMPGYSKEQFAKDFVQAPRVYFWQEVFARINPHADYLLMAEHLIVQMRQMFIDRVDIVEKGFRECHQRCAEGDPKWELWSTPARDDRILSAIFSFLTLKTFVDNQAALQPELSRAVFTQEGVSFSLQDLITAWMRGYFVSDPNVTPLERWGLHPKLAGQSVVEIYKKYFPLWEAWINRARSCTGGSCEFGSPQFMFENGFEFLNPLKDEQLRVRQYCSTFSEGLCKDLEKLLGPDIWAEVQATGRYNADPRHTSDKNWNGYFVGWAGFDHGNVIAVSPQKLLLARTNNLTHLYSLSGGAPVEVSLAGEKVLGLDEADGWIWSLRGRILRARRSLSDVPIEYDLGVRANDASMERADSGRALIHFLGTDEFDFIEASPSGINVIQHGQNFFGVMPLAPGLDGEYTVHESGRVFDYTRGIVEKIPNTYLMRVAPADGQAFVFLGSEAGGGPPRCGVAVNGQIRWLHQTGACAALGDQGNYIIVTEVNQTYEYKFDHWQNPVKTALGEPVLVNENMVRTKEHLFCNAPEGLIELSRAEDVVVECNSRWILQTGEQGEVEVIDRTTNRRHMKFHGSVRFYGPLSDDSSVVASVYDGKTIVSSLIDLDHLDRFSIFTSIYLDSDWNIRSHRRQSGIFIYESGYVSWLKSP